MTLADDDRCPCLSGQRFGACCATLHRGERRAPTAEALMRSRYTAFVVTDADYLRRSWHSSTRPADIDLDPGVRWLRLEIVRTADGGPFADEGAVEFRAIGRSDAGRFELHEVSRFVREQGEWRYLDGRHLPG